MVCVSWTNARILNLMKNRWCGIKLSTTFVFNILFYLKRFSSSIDLKLRNAIRSIWLHAKSNSVHTHVAHLSSGRCHLAVGQWVAHWAITQGARVRFPVPQYNFCSLDFYCTCRIHHTFAALIEFLLFFSFRNSFQEIFLM